MKKIAVLFLSFISASAFAATSTFKVVQNNPNNYGEASIQFEMGREELAVYAVNLDGSHTKILTSLKKGECVSITTPDQLIKYDGYYSVDQINSVKKVACSK